MARSKNNKGGPPKPAEAATGQMWAAVAHTAINQASALGKHVATMATICTVSYMLYKSIDAMAGKLTDFRSVIDWGVKVNASEYVAWAAAVVMTGAWGAERRSRKRMAVQAGPRLESLEKELDRGRTSSGLTPDGENPPEDQV